MRRARLALLTAVAAAVVASAAFFDFASPVVDLASSSGAPHSVDPKRSAAAVSLDHPANPPVASKEGSSRRERVETPDEALDSAAANPTPREATKRVASVIAPAASAASAHAMESNAADEYPPPGSRLVGEHLTVFHPDGSIKEAGSYRDGAKHGAWRYWSEEGQLELEGEYVSGLAEGLWRSWHPNGQQAGEGHTRAGQFHGECLFWKDTGALDVERSGWYASGVRERAL